MEKEIQEAAGLTAFCDVIGQKRVSPQWLEVTQDMIDRFADATLDHQYIHVDPERAKSSPLGTTVAHGFLTLSLLPHLLEEIELIPDNVLMGFNYGLNRVRFPNFVKVGSFIRAVATLKGVEFTSVDRILMTTDVTVEIQGEAKPAMFTESLAMWVLES